MKTLDRYVTALFLKNFALAGIGLIFLYMFQALIGELLDNEFPVHQILVLHLLRFPETFVQLCPPAILISTVLTLSGLNRTNELTACYSIGVGLNRLLSVIFSIVLMISCFSLIVQDRIIPPVFRKRTSYYWIEMKKRHDFFLDMKQDKIWYRSKNMIYNLRSFDSKSKSIVGMAVYTFDENYSLLQVIDAEKATYTPNGWKLLDGTVIVFSASDPFPMTQQFKEKDLDIAESPKDFLEIEKEVDGLRLNELKKYIQKTRTSGADTKAYEVKLHSRISLSFIPLVMAFLGVPFSTRNRREGGIARDLGLCLGVTFFYWLFYSIGLSLGTNGALPPWLAAWLPSAIFAAFAAGLISRNRN